MYRGIIEGHIFLTTFLRNQIVDRGLQQPFRGMGRIYRIVHEGRPLGTPPTIAPGNVAAWVPVLAHPNGHWRDMAQRMLVASRSKSVVPAVRTLAMSHEDARVRLHGLWTLEGLGGADDDLVRARLADTSPHVRIAALRIAEGRLSAPAMRRAVLALTDDTDVSVRRQVLYTLGASTTTDVDEARMRLLRRDVAAPFVVDAFMSGLAGREWQTLDTVVRSPSWASDRPEHRALVTALATAISNEGRAERVAALRRLSAESNGRPAWQREAVLEGVQASNRATQPATTAAAPRDAATAALVEQGRTAYALCAACHQADGRGLPATRPAACREPQGHGTARGPHRHRPAWPRRGPGVSEHAAAGGAAGRPVGGHPDVRPPGVGQRGATDCGRRRPRASRICRPGPVGPDCRKSPLAAPPRPEGRRLRQM